MNENKNKKRGSADNFDGIGKPNMENCLKDWEKINQ